MAISIISRQITLDVYRHDKASVTVNAIAADNDTRYVAAEIQNDGVRYDISSSATVELMVLRPDKVGVSIVGQPQELTYETDPVFDTDTGETTPGETVTYYGVYAELDQAALAKSGTLLGQFKITSGNQVLRTELFRINNGRALDAETSDWSGDYQGYNLDELVERVEALEQGGVPSSVKGALITLLKAAVYAETGLTDEIATIESWASATAELVSISASYSGGTVSAGASLDSLRSDLTVIATYQDSTTEVVTGYTLSGTLAEGTQTVTVSYGGKTTTFTVTVMAADELWINGLATGSTASFVYAPFVLPTETYDYDYSKQITAIEGNFGETGVISVGYYTGSHADGTAIDDSNIHISEVLTVDATGQKKLTLANPLSIPSGSALLIGAGTNTATFAYGGSLSNGFVYRNYTNNFKAQSKKLGMNVYRR